MYTILCYTPWVEDVVVKYYMGYVTISIVACHLMVNLTLIFSSTFTTTKWRCKRKYALKKYRWQRKITEASLKKNHNGKKERILKLRA